jgi:hypothetical protein
MAREGQKRGGGGARDEIIAYWQDGTLDHAKHASLAGSSELNSTGCQSTLSRRSRDANCRVGGGERGMEGGRERGRRSVRGLGNG